MIPVARQRPEGRCQSAITLQLIVNVIDRVATGAKNFESSAGLLVTLGVG